MRSISLEKRRPEGPRWVSRLTKAPWLFQRAFSCALATVAVAVRAMADAPMSPSFSRLLDMWQSSLSQPSNARAPGAQGLPPHGLRQPAFTTAQIVGAIDCASCMPLAARYDGF